MSMSIKQAHDQWRESNVPALIDQYGKDDEVAFSEDWNNYTDALCKDGELTDLQYHYCPAWDEDMPDSDQQFILEQMGLAMAALKIKERPDGNDGQWDADASHWRLLLKRGSKEIEVYYSQGSAHSNEPDLDDVMYCLLSDVSDIEDVDFEEWASNLGYDTDSRKAERTFEACKKQLLNLRLLFTNKELEQLHELYQDF